MYRKPGDWQRTRHYLARRQAVLNWVQRSKLLEVLLAQSEGLRHTIRKPVMMQMYLQEPRGRHLQLPVEESGFADLLLWEHFHISKALSICCRWLLLFGVGLLFSCSRRGRPWGLPEDGAGLGQVSPGQPGHPAPYPPFPAEVMRMKSGLTAVYREAQRVG